MTPDFSTLTMMCAVAFAYPVCRCEAQHPEWGPEPPVAPFTRAALPTTRVAVEMTFPVIGGFSYNDDYNANRHRNRHTGIDIRAPRMSPIVAPFRGVLGMKRESFWIFGDNGWAVLGTHLNDDDLGKHNHQGTRDVMFAPGLEPGQFVEAGQFIGYVGMSGDATGPHLHFELYAPGNGPTGPRIRDPYPSLKRATVLSKPIAVTTALSGSLQKDEMLFDACVRKVDPSQDAVTVLLTAKQAGNGRAVPVTHVRYLKLHLSDEALQEAGGWDSLAHLSRTRTLGFVLGASDHPDGSSVRRVVTQSQLAFKR